MKQYNIAFVWVALIWLVSPGDVKAQTRINVKVGAEVWSLKDEKELPVSSRHPGQTLGLDVFIANNKLLFVPGFHYHRFSVQNEEKSFSFRFGDSHHLHYFSIPLTIGYKVFEQPFLDIALLGGGEVFFFYKLDDNNLGLDDDMLYGVSTALTGMVHLTLFSIVTAEVRYHYALQPIIKIRDDSKLRGVTLAAGFKF